MCVSGFSPEKKIGMVSRHNILFCQNILYRNLHFSIHFSPFSSKFDNVLLTIHNKMFKSQGKNLGSVGKPENLKNIYTCICFWPKQEYHENLKNLNI